MTFNLTNSDDLVVNSLSLIEKDKIIDVKELFLSKLDAIENIVGLAPDTLNTLANLGEAINNDSEFYNNLIRDLSFKANTRDVYTKLETYSEAEVDNMMNQSLSDLGSQLSLKANIAQIYSRTMIDSNIEILRADTDTKVALNYNKEQTNLQSSRNQ